MLRLPSPGVPASRQGFTLVELVAVVLIIGILAAVAAPRLLSMNELALENALLQDLQVLRDAIAHHAAEHGGFPGNQATEADVKADLAPYLREFPKNPLKDSDTIYVRGTGLAFTATQGGGYGWLYDSQSGDIRANSNGMSSDDVKRYFQR